MGFGKAKGKGQKDEGQWVFMPAVQKSFRPKGKGNGDRKQRTDSHEDEDPAGSVRVYVIGFDFGTTDEQLEGHMKRAGPIHTVHWVTKGKAVVVYKKKASAAKAAALNETTIDGNSRYITVLTGDN